MEEISFLERCIQNTTLLDSAHVDKCTLPQHPTKQHALSCPAEYRCCALHECLLSKTPLLEPWSTRTSLQKWCQAHTTVSSLPLADLAHFYWPLATYMSFFGPDPLFWVLGSDAHSFLDIFTLMTHVHLKLSMSKMKMVIFLSYISPGFPCLNRWPQHPKVNDVRFLSDFTGSPNLLAIFTGPAGLTSKVSLRSVLPFS